MRKLFLSPATLVFLLGSFCQASLLFQVSLDTSALQAHPAAPFLINFQLNDGSGTGDANNTATISQFDFGIGGMAAGPPLLIGGAYGDSVSGIQIVDCTFFNDFTQAFIAGNKLSFRVVLTTIPDAGLVPDQFSFALLDRTFGQVPTQSPFDVFLLVDIDSAAAVQSFASDPSQPPRAGGPAIDMFAPDVTQETSIPEPASGLAVFGALVLAAGRLLYRRWVGGISHY